jgi:hypothetical protein
MLPPELTSLAATVEEIIALGTFALALAGILGYRANKWDGAFPLVMLSSVATLICLAGYIGFGLLGYSSRPAADMAGRIARTGAWAPVGLVIAVIVVAGLGARAGRRMGTSEPGKRRGAIFVPALWIGFCFACWIGHRAGMWVGLLCITLPAVMIFWLCLYYLAHFVLPLDEDQPVSMALRCMVTFSAGINYPCYGMEGREKVERVPGSQSEPLLAGPGILLTGPDHAVAVSDGLKFKGVRGPGVVFTHFLESIQEPIDLRSQQRAYSVEAITKDGIPVQVSASGSFQLHAGGQRPEAGESFPLRASSIFQAFHAQPVDIRRDERDGEVVEERKRRRWDELYEIVGTHVMQDIVAEYGFSELCEPLDPDQDPRGKIAKKYRVRLQQELAGYGIRVLGGGITNLLPSDEDKVPERRLLNWQAQWQHRMLEQFGAAEVETERLIEQTRPQVQAEMARSIDEAIQGVAADDVELIITTVAVRFVQSIEQMVEEPQINERLPPDVPGIVHKLPHIIGGPGESQDAG